VPEYKYAFAWIPSIFYYCWQVLFTLFSLHPPQKSEEGLVEPEKVAGYGLWPLHMWPNGVMENADERRRVARVSGSVDCGICNFVEGRRTERYGYE
jgi:hypothetical protein